ncbi:MAG: hypothetical protein H7Z42_13070 [Roseiflexaceae bacterium]|nr:hypothetical protein [Roseiflexaceae bacterium]
MTKRWVMLLAGLVLYGVGIALMVRSQLGLNPWDILHQGISERTGISIGVVGIFTGVLIMLAWFPLGQRPGWGTLVNIVLIGLVTDAALAILPDVTMVALRVLLLAGGILAIGFGSGLYLSADMGAGPRDGLMVGLTRTTGWNVRTVRTAIELTVLVIGWVLGGTVGIGTLAFAFGIGPVVQFALRLLGVPIAAPVVGVQPAAIHHG